MVCNFFFRNGIFWIGVNNTFLIQEKMKKGILSFNIKKNGLKKIVFLIKYFLKILHIFLTIFNIR